MIGNHVVFKGTCEYRDYSVLEVICVKVKDVYGLICCVSMIKAQ
jgi:hypothetical protein